MFCGGSLEFSKSYGHLTICERCHDAMFLRRAMAFAVDVGAFSLVTCCFGGVMNLVGALAKAEATAETFSTVTTAALWLVGFLARDSFGGRSLGKLLLGLRVVDLADRRPSGLSTSVARNLPLLNPIGPLVAIVQLLRNGTRWGEAWTNSMVVRV